MKPYFENEKIIIPYNLVESVKIIKNNPSILVKACNDCEYFSLDQLDNYKLWLENKSPDAGKMVNSNSWQPTIEQVNEIGSIVSASCSYCYNFKYDTCPDGCNYKITPEKYQEIIEKLKEMENGK